MQGKKLHDVYKKPSQEKIDAWEKILHEYISRKGYDITVCGNSYTFSVTYFYKDDYNHVHMVYHTRDNVRDKVVWSKRDIIGMYNDSAFSAYCILHISEDGEKAVSCHLYNDDIYDVKCTTIKCTRSGRFYIVRNKRKLYLDDFLKI